MGNSTSKRSKACSEALLAFDSGEVETLEAKFRETAALRGGSGKEVGADALTQVLGLSPALGGRLFKGMAAAASKGGSGLSFDDFATAVGKCCGGSRYERREFWLSVMLDGGRLTKQALRDFYTEEVALALPKSATADFRGKLIEESVQQALEEGGGGGEMDAGQTEKWLAGQQRVEAFFSEVVAGKFLKAAGVGGGGLAKKMPRLKTKSMLLQEEHLWALAGHLPPSCNAAPWKQLFSSFKHGKSFNRLMSKIIFKGPTVIVVKDKGGNSFGMFAGVSWRKDNKFYGESSSFLFSLAPKCKVYPSSGVNQNYQWMSTNLTSCANGIGMGGQKDFWGIHLGCMLEEGVCRAPCSTFVQMPCLSTDAQFVIDQVEAWGCIPDYLADEKELEAAGVKKKPKKTLDAYLNSGNKTCLDGDVEAQAILDAAGRTNYSSDVRAADALADKEREALQGGPDAWADSDSEDLEYDD